MYWGITGHKTLCYASKVLQKRCAYWLNTNCQLNFRPISNFNNIWKNLENLLPTLIKIHVNSSPNFRPWQLIRLPWRLLNQNCSSLYAGQHLLICWYNYALTVILLLTLLTTSHHFPDSLKSTVSLGCLKLHRFLPLQLISASGYGSARLVLLSALLEFYRALFSAP